MSEIKEIGKKNKIYYNPSDSTPCCYHCGQPSKTIIGQVTMDGEIQDLRKCDGCNVLFTKHEGGIHEALKEARSLASTASVTLSTDNSTQSVSSSNNTLSSNMANIDSNISTMSFKLERLINAITAVVDQNNKLQKQIASDPFVNFRDKINNFELK